MSKISKPNCPMCFHNKNTKLRILESKEFGNEGEMIGGFSKTIVTKFDFYCKLHGIVYLDVREGIQDKSYENYEKDDV